MTPDCWRFFSFFTLCCFWRRRNDFEETNQRVSEETDAAENPDEEIRRSSDGKKPAETKKQGGRSWNHVLGIQATPPAAQATVSLPASPSTDSFPD